MRLGFVADLLSQPILIGYMAGVAVIMIVSPARARSPASSSRRPDPIARIVELAGRLDEVRPLTLALGGGVVVFLLVLRRLKPLAPGTLIAVVGAGLVVWAFGLEAQGDDRRRARSRAACRSRRCRRSALGGRHGARSGSAAAITFVALLRRRAHRARVRGPDRRGDRPQPGVPRDGRWRTSRPGLTGGFALSASGSRTAIIDAMRARTQVAGLVAAAAWSFVVLAVPG